MNLRPDNLLSVFFDWLTSWFVAAGVSRQIDRVSRRLTALERSREKTVAQLRKRERDLRRIHTMFQTKWATAWNKAEIDIERSRSLIKQYEEELEALRLQIQIRDELTIPGLTDNFKVIEAQNHAMIALENQRRQIAVDPDNRRTA